MCNWKLDSNASPFITQPEFMRRMKEMSQSGGMNVWNG
jgi:molecular chaperone HtpG